MFLVAWGGHKVKTKKRRIKTMRTFYTVGSVLPLSVLGVLLTFLGWLGIFFGLYCGEDIVSSVTDLHDNAMTAFDTISGALR